MSCAQTTRRELPCRRESVAAAWTGSVAPALVSALAIAARWIERSRQRRALAEMEAHRLADIGLTAEEAHRESVKLFWLE